MVFRILGVPVYVSMAFWATALVLGFLGWRTGPLALSWVAVTLVAVLVHELGHALVGRKLGGAPTIMLHGLGGTTSLSDVTLSRTQGALFAVAGPLAGFALGLACMVALRLTPPGPGHEALRMGVIATFGYGALNLLPILPFDGWFVLREALGPRRERVALWVSVVLAFAAVLTVLRLSARVGPMWPLPAGWLTFSVVQSLRAVWGHRGRQALMAARTAAAAAELAAAIRAGRSDQWREAEARAFGALGASDDPDVRDGARRVLVEAALSRDDGALAITLLGNLEGRRPEDDVARARALDVSGERAAAFVLLERRAAEDPGGPALAPLLTALIATGQSERAISLGLAHASDGDHDALLGLVSALLDRGDLAGAARVVDALVSRNRALASDPRLASLRARLTAEPPG